MTPRRRTDWRVLALMAFSASLLSGPDSFRGAPAARASVRGSTASPEFWARSLETPAAIAEQLATIDDLVAGALDEGKLPGCVVVIGRHDRVLFHKAYGKRALMPEPATMTEDTVFDLASLTKPIATGVALMILAERGALGLDERVDR